MFNIFKKIFGKNKKEEKELIPIETVFFDNDEREDDEYLRPIAITLLELKDHNKKVDEDEGIDEKFYIEFDPQIERFYELLHDIYNYGSEYKIDTIETIDQILKNYKELIITERSQNKEKIKEIETIFPKINKALENIYYNTVGAAVYMNEKEIKEFKNNFI